MKIIKYKLTLKMIEREIKQLERIVARLELSKRKLAVMRNLREAYL